MYVRKLLGKKYDLSSFNYGETFTIELDTKDSIVHLDFGDTIVKFRCYEEELSDFDESIQIYLNTIKDEIANTTLIEIVDSPLLQKLSLDTNNFYSESYLKHYILILMNYIIEIVTYDDVKIS